MHAFLLAFMLSSIVVSIFFKKIISIFIKVMYFFFDKVKDFVYGLQIMDIVWAALLPCLTSFSLSRFPSFMLSYHVDQFLLTTDSNINYLLWFLAGLFTRSTFNAVSCINKAVLAFLLHIMKKMQSYSKFSNNVLNYLVKSIIQLYCALINCILALYELLTFATAPILAYAMFLNIFLLLNPTLTLTGAILRMPFSIPFAASKIIIIILSIIIISGKILFNDMMWLTGTLRSDNSDVPYNFFEFLAATMAFFSFYYITFRGRELVCVSYGNFYLSQVMLYFCSWTLLAVFVSNIFWHIVNIKNTVKKYAEGAQKYEEKHKKRDKYYAITFSLSTIIGAVYLLLRIVFYK